MYLSILYHFTVVHRIIWSYYLFILIYSIDYDEDMQVSTTENFIF